MEPVDMSTRGDGDSANRPCDDAPAVLRLYIARSTPNSVRAEQNLTVALDSFGEDLTRPAVEIIDVFTRPKRALTDGVVVTPTLIGLASSKRVVLMGDLSDQSHLHNVLHDLMTSRP